MVTRRDFLKTMSMASAGLALGTGDLLHAQTASPKKGRGDKVKIAYIGIGNRGEQIIEDFARTGMVEVVALCDVDMGAKHTQKIMAKYPKAKQFRDFRQMFDKAGNEFDAVAIATASNSLPALSNIWRKSLNCFAFGYLAIIFCVCLAPISTSHKATTSTIPVRAKSSIICSPRLPMPI